MNLIRWSSNVILEEKHNRNWNPNEYTRKQRGFLAGFCGGIFISFNPYHRLVTLAKGKMKTLIYWNTLCISLIAYVQVYLHWRLVVLNTGTKGVNMQLGVHVHKHTHLLYPNTAFVPQRFPWLQPPFSIKQKIMIPISDNYKLF